MTKLETVRILAILKAAYPTFYKEMGKDDVEATINLWAEMFKEEPVNVVASALKTFIVADTKGYPPYIGAIKESVYQLTHSDIPSEMEMWGKVREAIDYYSAGEKFNALPPIARQIVGSPRQLAQWAVMDADHVESVVASNFMRSYREAVKKQQQFDKIPESIKKQLGGAQIGQLPKETK